MESSSPPRRIDQFFSSKKRKPVSPGLKCGRIEKDANTTLEISPSAKGTLDNFLVTSQDCSRAAKLSCTAPGSLDLKGPVKRNLTLEIDNSSKDGSKQPPWICQSVEGTKKGASTCSSDVGDATTADLEKGCSVSVQGTKDSELRQFATDFLSLYCCELKSNVSLQSNFKVNDQKRHGSPSLLDFEGKTSKKRYFTASQSKLDGETTSCHERNPNNMHSGFGISAAGESAFKSSRELTGGDPTELQEILKKCNKTSIMAECHTPCSLTVKACKTPKSTRGSSIFSPGEDFWNEAIQLADGLCAPTDNFSGQAAEEITILDNHSDLMHSCNVRHGNYEDRSKEMLNEGESRVRQIKVGASLGSLGNGTKDLDKLGSPLPVKHFDFSHEDNNVDDSIPHYLDPINLKSVTDRGSTDFEFISVNEKGSRHIGAITPCGNLNANEELNAVQEMTPSNAVTKWKEKVSQDNDSIRSSALVNKTTSCIGNHENGEASTPSSFVLLKDQLDLSSWLPSAICSVYRKKGISKLYPWQVNCLKVDGVLQRRNLVYCASTSAGKSFVAEILMLRRVMSTEKMALLVLPYVSICAEKAEHLEVVLEPLGKQVRSYYGNQGGGTLPKGTSVAVCTIEKANSLINRLLEEGRLSEIGIIVIDELHMVGDQSRGYLLELLLTKLRYATGESYSESSSGESSGTSSGKTDPAHGLQIVGMSATMPNVAAVADWLQAALYQTEFRPVPLEEYIKVGNTIYNKKMDVVRTISKTADISGKDPDHVVELCNEVVQDGHSVLIFCSSRKGCESTARHVSKFLKKFTVDQNNDIEFVNISSAIDTLRKCPAGLDPILEETLPSGVAYHHAGLTVEEREIVETCYRKGLIRVLTATSTLAAGVNLPARRVIFRQPRIGRDFIDGTRYKQMAGRAGRTGIDTKGESVLICKAEEIKRIMGLLNESGPELHSCLSEDKNGMTHAILEVVAGGIVQTANDIHCYVKCTLLNSTKPFQDVVKSAQDSLQWLCHKKFLEWNEHTKLYSTTPLGRAAFGSSLCPEESLIVLDDLQRAREGFVLATDLHLVYLVTPINIDVPPDWELYYERFMELSALDKSVGNRVGVAEPFLMRMAHGAPMHTSYKSKDHRKRLPEKFETRPGITSNSMLPDEQTHRVCKRFYVALILSRLVQEAPVTEVCEAFKVARGTVQSLQENAGKFAPMVSLFCERLGWHDIEGLVAKFQNRVSFGVRADIAELTTIPYVKGSRARILYNAGLRTPLAIAEASIPEIFKALFESSAWAAQVGSAQRRMQLGVAKKIKNGARKIILDKAEEARVAAFSAFKSLGFHVPEFSGPLLLTAVDNPTGQGPAATPSGDNTTNNFVREEQILHVSGTSSMNGVENSDKVLSGIEAEKLRDASVINLEASSEANPTVAMQHTFGPEIPFIPVECSTLGPELNKNHTPNVVKMVEEIGDETRTYASHLHHGVHLGNCRENLCGVSKENDCEEGPLHATSIVGGFDSFLDLWDSMQEFYFDIHYGKCLGVNSIAPFEIHGIAICGENSPVFYVSLPKDLLPSENKRNKYSLNSAAINEKDALSREHCLETVKHRWNKIGEIMHKRDVRKFAWNLKIQIQVLKNAAVSIHRFGRLNFEWKTMGLELIDGSYFLLPRVHVNDGIDMCIVAWIIWPDEERSSNPNIEKEVKKRLSSEAAAAAFRNGRWKNQMRRAAHNGCCRRVAQTRALCSVLWKLLLSEGLVEPLLNIEVPLVNVLADMELWGIGVDMEACVRARNVLGKKLRCLEKEAYKLAGMTFSMYTSADIASVLYGHLKLPIPEGHNKGKQHPSTDKHCLDLLRHEHPIIPVIKEHRTLAKLLNCTLGSICSMARLSARTQKYTLHGHWLQTSTATGRLSIEEPNLQCVQHTVIFNMNKDKDGDDVDVDAHDYQISARDFFVSTQDNWLLLTADYSQIELRLMAHFSKDSLLIELLSKPDGDVFAMIAARWNGKPEDSVISHERDQTKRLVYGILYGMGPSSLAEQLDCSSDEAAEKIKSFKSSFPGVASWLHETVTSCRQKGYVETLKGRKRFLSKIKFGNSKEKSKAERQAVNSICQGSAADIIKIAMINIYSVIVEGIDRPDSSFSLTSKFHMLKGRCRISLQVHDELVLEVDPPVINEAALLLQRSMEDAALLLVPLHVKLKVGRTWGSLEPLQIEKYKDEALVRNS